MRYHFVAIDENRLIVKHETMCPCISLKRGSSASDRRVTLHGSVAPEWQDTSLTSHGSSSNEMSTFTVQIGGDSFVTTVLKSNALWPRETIGPHLS